MDNIYLYRGYTLLVTKLVKTKINLALIDPAHERSIFGVCFKFKSGLVQKI